MLHTVLNKSWKQHPIKQQLHGHLLAWFVRSEDEQDIFSTSGTSGGVMVSKLDKQTFTSEFESHWVPYPYHLMPASQQKKKNLSQLWYVWHMDSYTWTHQWWPTSKNLHSSALCWISFRGLPRMFTDRDE